MVYRNFFNHNTSHFCNAYSSFLHAFRSGDSIQKSFLFWSLFKFHRFSRTLKACFHYLSDRPTLEDSRLEPGHLLTARKIYLHATIIISVLDLCIDETFYSNQKSCDIYYISTYCGIFNAFTLKSQTSELRG